MITDEILKLECILSGNVLSFEELKKYFYNKNSKIIINNNHMWEIELFYNTIKTHTTLYTIISEIILKTYFVNTINNKSVDNENSTFIEFYYFLESLKLTNNTLKLMCDLISMWIIHVFYKVNLFNDTVENNIVWKTRYDIIGNLVTLMKQFLNQIEIVLNFKINFNKDSRNVFFTLLHILANNEYILIKKIKKKEKTEKYMALKDNCFISMHVNYLDIYKHPREIIILNNQLYYFGYHYSLLKQIIRPNIASKVPTKITNLTFLKKRSALKLFLKWSLVKKFKTTLLEHFKLNKNTSETEFNDYITKLKLNFWQKNKQKEFNQIFVLKYIYFLEKLENELKDGFYFSYYIDFRGRLYTDSPIGYTHNKIFRYLYHYGEYTDKDLNEICIHKTWVNTESFKQILNNTAIVAQYPNIQWNKDVTIYYICTIFFELGKIVKNKYIQSYKGVLTYDNFIQFGIELYNNYNIATLTIDKKIEILTLFDILENLNNRLYLKIPIFKDATASALQILVLLLGSINTQKYHICNLTDSTKWYDTYYFIINEFITIHNIPSELCEKYFNRSNLKKTIMTFNYEATFLTCWKDFKKNADILEGDSTHNYKLIEMYFTLFYKFLAHIFDKNEFFARPSIEILKIFRQQWETKHNLLFTLGDEVTISYDYYKIIKQRLDRIILNQRETIQWNIRTDEIDSKKMFRALRANIIHSFDGFLVRAITLKLNQPIITIHDSFGIDILSIDKLIIITQNEMQLLFEKDFFNLKTNNDKLQIQSKFILL